MITNQAQSKGLIRREEFEPKQGGEARENRGVRSVWLGLLLAGVFALDDAAATSNYSIAVNGGGYITRISYDPQNPNACWVGSDIGGLFKSSDGCQTFSAANMEFWRSDQYGIDDISIDPSNSNVIFVLGGEYTEDASGASGQAVVMGFGLWKSTDAGASFSAVDPGYSIKGLNTSTGAVTYNTSASSYIRNDGRRAERLTIDGVEGQRHVADGKRIAFDPSSCATGTCQTIYVADFKNGIYKSTDAGTTFKQLPLPSFKDYYSSTVSSPNVRVSSIELVPYTSGTTTSYLLLVGTRRAHQTAVTTAPIAGQLYLGFNGGENALDWVSITPTLATGLSFEALDISVSKGADVGTVSSTDTTDYFYVAAGKGGILRGHFDALSTSAKTATITWKEPTAACSGTSWSSGYDIGLSCDAGTSTTTDCSSTSTDCIRNATQTGTYVAVEVDPSDTTGKKLYALGLAQGSVYYSKDGGTNWSSVYDSTKLNYNSSWFNQHSWKFADFATSLAYRYNATSYKTAQIAFTDWWSVWKATGNGTTSFKAYNSGIRNLVVNDIKLDPYDKKRTYIAVSDHAFFYSSTYGISGITYAGTGSCSPYSSASATCLTSGIDSGQGVGVAVETSTNQSNASVRAKYVFLATKRTDGNGVGKVYQSEDNGATWTSILPSSFTSGEPSALLYDENFSGLWLAWNDDTSGSALYKLTLSGSTWSATAYPDVATTLGSTDLFKYATKLRKASPSGTTLYVMDQDKGLYALNTSTGAKSFSAAASAIASKQCSNDGSSSSTCDWLSVAANTSGTVFVGTGGAGVWSSSDSGVTWTQLGTADAYYTYRNVRDISIPSKDTTGKTLIASGDSDLSDHWSSTYYADCTCSTTSCSSNGKICTISGVMFSFDGGSTFKDLSELTCSTSANSPGEAWGRNISSGTLPYAYQYFYYFTTAGQGAQLLNLRTLKSSCGLSLPY